MNHYDYLDGYRESAGTVYIVDDDDAVRDSLKWLLEASNYHVELYDSGESFIAKYDPNTIAVLVLDIRMPGMSGLEVQEHLLQRKADIPIIFVTGHGDVTMAVQAFKAGAVDFIEKPYDQNALKALIERMLEVARTRHIESERRKISIKTVEAPRASIMDKTNSGTVADLMRVFMESRQGQNFHKDETHD